MFPACHPNPLRHDQSGVHVVASVADFHQFRRQAEEATAFLLDHAEQVQRLCKWPGVEDMRLDFRVERRDVAVQCDYLPPDLSRVAGLLGLGIELTQYPARSAAPVAEPGAAADRAG